VLILRFFNHVRDTLRSVDPGQWISSADLFLQGTLGWFRRFLASA
jgi:hypothetical protein